MMRKSTWLGGVAGALVLVAAGCLPKRPEPVPKALVEIVDDLDTNNARVTTLQGKVGVSVRAPGKTVFVTLGGRLNFAKPDRLHLQITKFGRLEFSLGADGRRYWFWSREALFGDTPNTLWTGSVGHIERASARGLILRPDIVADALGVAALRTTQPNLAVLERYKREFVLDYVRLADGRLRLLKKVRLDRMTGRMTRIDYFAPNGTQILFATFDGERTTDDVRLIRRVTLEMPLSDAAVRFDLRTLRLNRRLGPNAFTQPDFDDANHIDLDKEP